MSAESDFADTVKICEFYSDTCEVDPENRIVFMGAREILPVGGGNGHLDRYLVIDPDGFFHVEDDLDEYLQFLFADSREDR